MQKRERYLVATDGSVGGREAVRHAIELARTSGAVLAIVYVRQAPLPALEDPFYQRFYQRVLSEELARARTVVEDAAVEAGAAGVTTEVDILEGSPADRIVELARHRGVDMIVVGSRGRDNAAAAVLGSVSEAVARKADRPVLVVRPRAAAVGRRAA